MQAIDALFEAIFQLAEERRYRLVFELVERGDHAVGFLPGLDVIDKRSYLEPAQAPVADGFRKHPGKEKREVADMLADLPLASEAVASPQRIGFQQHLAN